MHLTQILAEEKFLCEIKFADDINRCCVHLNHHGKLYESGSSRLNTKLSIYKLWSSSRVWSWQKFPLWPNMTDMTSCPLQGFVFLGYESVSVAHVHLFLVLRHSRHGHRHLHLQIHWVLWVSNHHDSIGLRKIVLQQLTSNYSASGYFFSWMRVMVVACFNLPYMLLIIYLHHHVPTH